MGFRGGRRRRRRRGRRETDTSHQKKIGEEGSVVKLFLYRSKNGFFFCFDQRLMRWKIGRRGRGGGRGGGASSTSVSPDMTLRRAFLLLLLLRSHCRRRLQKGHIPSQAASPETFSLPFPAGDIESKLCPMCIVPRHGCDDDGILSLSLSDRPGMGFELTCGDGGRTSLLASFDESGCIPTYFSLIVRACGL